MGSEKIHFRHFGDTNAFLWGGSIHKSTWKEFENVQNLKHFLTKFLQVKKQTSYTLLFLETCKRCRAEARMKTEIREKENAGSMEAWSYAQYAGETERETNRKLYFKIMHSLNVHMCVFNAHFYTSPLED